MTFYAQHGEDILLDQMLESEKGFFVEVGCVDGRRASNTLALEERGWNGICIEANLSFMEILMENRPGSIVIPCAAGNRNHGGVRFYNDPRGSMSSLEKDGGNGVYERSMTVVEMRTLTDIFDELNVTDIDVISIDVEGSECDVLMGLDLGKYNPRIFIIEAQDECEVSKIDDILIPWGYHKSFRLINNVFYLRDDCENLVRKIYGRKFNGDIMKISQQFVDDFDDYSVRIHINAVGGTIERIISWMEKPLRGKIKRMRILIEMLRAKGIENVLLDYLRTEIYFLEFYK